MAQTNVQAFSGDVEISSNLEVSGNLNANGNFLLSDGYTQIKDNVRVLNGETLFYDPDNVLRTARRTILEINANAPNSSNTAQREYAGCIELEMTAQRSVAGYNTHSGGFVGRLNFALGYTTFSAEEWGPNSFVQEIKAYDPDTSSNGLENVPRFRYKLDDATKKLQIFIEFDYQRIEASITWSVRMSSDSLDDVSIPSPTSEMSEGTLTTAPLGLAYDKDGNVGIGSTNPQYKLDVSGSLAQSGQKIYPERRWEVDLSSGTSTSNFYPLYLETDAFDANIGPYMFPVTFNVIGESLAGADPFSEETLVGYARGGGATDHAGMCKVHSRRYEGNEFRCLGIWEGTANQLGIVIYLRGGYKYSVITNATNVVVNTSSYGKDSSIWAVKNASKTDVVGTSLNINELQDVSAFVQMGEVNSFTGSLILPQNYQRVGIGTVNPQASLHTYSSPGSETALRLQSGRGDQPSLQYYWSGTNAENFIMSDGDATGYFYGRKYTTGTNANSNAGWRFYGSGNLGVRINASGHVGIGQDNPDRPLHVNSSSCRFGNIKFNSGFAAQPADTSTGVNMKGFNGGGGVLFVMTFHNGSGDGTATRVVFLRKTYNATWTQSSNNTTPIVSQHSSSTQNGTVSFDTSSDILRYRYSIGGNSHFYVIEFDGG